MFDHIAIDWRDIMDIAVVSILLYQVIQMLRGSRALTLEAQNRRSSAIMVDPGDAWFRQGPNPEGRESRCRQASLNRRRTEVTGNRQPALALAA